MAKATVEIVGLKEFRRELKQISADFGSGGELPKSFRRGLKDIADDAATSARAIAASMGGVHAKGARFIKGYAKQAEASIGFQSGGIAGAAFWGMKRNTGWNAHALPGGRRQHPPWIGNNWEPGEAGQGPYAINNAIAHLSPDLELRFKGLIEHMADQAFPD